MSMLSSSQPWASSLPSQPPQERRKSRFTFRQLAQLAQYSTSTPLRVIAHVDLDAFYAQCEGIRLGLAEDQPLAVQQWTGLIAVNYPARAHGISRFHNIKKAREQCPNLVLQHVATWREGDEKWQYHEDAAKHMATHKVSLDPYRLQSRQIFALIQEVLPASQRVEKAGIDEVFLDLSAQIHGTLLERFPELQGPPPYDDPTEHLPRPPMTALDWKIDALVDLDESETEQDDPDWDDFAMQIASEIVRDLRAAIRERLKYTCSAGIARNKMLAKLGSGHKKPNCQTVVRNRAVQQFLNGYKLTKIRNLGGKLGEQVVNTFGSDEVKELLAVPIEQMKLKLGDDTGSWVYHVVRGEESGEITPRTQIKSMLSAKSFQPSINTRESANRWLRIFVADIYSRLVEEGVLEHKRWPKTMTLHHRQGGNTRARQIAIPSRSISEAQLFDLAKTLLGQAIVDARLWPCSNLSLSVGGFEEGPTNNRGIGSFLVTGAAAKVLNAVARRDEDGGHVNKRRRVDDSIGRLLGRQDTSTGDENSAHESEGEESDLPPDAKRGVEDAKAPEEARDSAGYANTHQSTIEAFLCPRCQAQVPVSEQAEHDDWHFAKDLQTSERATSRPAPEPASKKPARASTQRGRKSELAKGPERGQRKLDFG